MLLLFQNFTPTSIGDGSPELNISLQRLVMFSIESEDLSMGKENFSIGYDISLEYEGMIENIPYLHTVIWSLRWILFVAWMYWELKRVWLGEENCTE